MPRFVIVCGAVAAIVFAPAVAGAQRRGDVAQDIAELREQVTALRQAAATTATVAETLQEIDQRLAVLEQEVKTLAREQKSIPDARAALDELARRLGALEQTLRGVRTSVTELERPAVMVAPSGDAAFSGAIDGYAQVRSSLGVAEAFDDFESATLQLVRGRIGLRGHLGLDELRYRVVLEVTGTRPARDFYFDYLLHPAVALRAGLYKVPFTRSFLTSSTRLAFPDRPALIERYRYGRDVQLGAHGAVLNDRLQYYVGIGNGSGANDINDNIDYAVSARVAYGVLGGVGAYAMGDVVPSDELQLTLGGGAVYDLTAMPGTVPGVNNALGEPVPLDTDVDQDGVRDNVAVLSASVDAHVTWSGWSATAEWLVRHEDWGTIVEVNPALRDALDAIGGEGQTRVYQGFYGQVTYMLLPRLLMVGARAGHSRQPLLGLGERPDGAPVAARLFEASALVQLYDDAFGGRALGLQYSFTNANARGNAEEPAADKTHLFLLETQFVF